MLLLKHLALHLADARLEKLSPAVRHCFHSDSPGHVGSADDGDNPRFG